MDSKICAADVDAKPLKKRPTKRGLTRAETRSEDTISDYAAETSVYSGCVQRSSIFSLSNLSCTPLLPIESNHTKLSEIALSTNTQPKERKSRKAAKITVLDVDLCDDENSSSPVNSLRSPSPPPPPPPPVTVRRKPRRAKGIQHALQTLNNMKGALSMASRLSLSPVIVDDSPTQHAQIVRIRHISTVHKFSMAKTDLFYKLQQQMAGVLQVEAEKIGLFLNDRRLGGGDTPQSVNLHLADIVECHILVPRAADNEQAEAADEDTCHVVLQCSNIRRNKRMTIKKVLFENYAKLQERPLSSFKFRFDGELLSADATPYDIDLEDGDTIDVIEI